MDEDWKRETLERHRAHLADRKAFAQHMLDNIAAGWTFQEAHGNEPLQDVTADRRAHYEREITRSDELLAEYERWYGA